MQRMKRKRKKNHRLIRPDNHFLHFLYSDNDSAAESDDYPEIVLTLAYKKAQPQLNTTETDREKKLYTIYLSETMDDGKKCAKATNQITKTVVFVPKQLYIHMYYFLLDFAIFFCPQASSTENFIYIK